MDTPSPRARRRWSNGTSERHDSRDMSEYRPSPGNDETAFTENTGNINESNQDRQQPTSNLGNSMMRTVVASGNDALNILFEAAAAHSRGNGMTTDSQPGNTISSESRTTRDEDSLAGGYSGPFEGSTRTVYPVEISRVSKEVLDVWESCRFVKMGWFTSREAVTFIDLYASFSLDIVGIQLTEWRQVLQKHVSVIPHTHRLLRKSCKSLLSPYARSSLMLHNPNGICSLSRITRRRRRIKKLLYPPPTLAALPATNHTPHIWPG